jgi:hypothetical protein
MMSYLSPDGTVVFNLVGPLAIFDRTMPERISIVSLKGLIPPWENIEQKGATQDGATYVTSLYDPMLIEMEIIAQGRNPAYFRDVMRAWIDSWDAKNPGKLSWTTRELGTWWANVQFDKPPLEPIMGGQWYRQKFHWYAKAYDSFWRTYDSTDAFGVHYATTAVDNFSTSYPSSLGPNWAINYLGTAGGYIYSTGQAVASALNAGTTAVARFATQTASDIQTVMATIGALPTDGTHYGAIDLWARMNNTGTPGTDGIRLRIAPGGSTIFTLSSFVGGVETVLRQATSLVPLQANDQIMLTAGAITDTLRSYTVQIGSAVDYFNANIIPTVRNAVLPLMTVIESATAPILSALGAAYQSTGLGAVVAAAGQLPAQILNFSIGPPATPTTTGSGYLTRVNVGDQPMWDRFTLIGPGTFWLGNGPNATSYISMGPLLENQIVQVRCDPRKRGVVDLTSSPSSPQQQAGWIKAWNDFMSFISNNASANPPTASIFGVIPPQGNLYSLLHGRFSIPIPPKPSGAPAPVYQVPVAITDGNQNSAILVAGTPLRRFPQ